MSNDFNPFDPFGLSSLDNYYVQPAPQAQPVPPAPQQPVQPVQPAPQQPVQPVPQVQPLPQQPVQPVQPAPQQPVQPVQPVQPLPQQPVQPVQPLPQQPVQPVQPVQPAPQQPVQPVPQVQPAPQVQPNPSGVNVVDNSGSKPEEPKIPANFRIGDHVKLSDAVKIPPHELNFNEQEFLKLLAASVSLKKHEKLDIINRIPKLKQFQINELMRIFKSESDKFAELPKEHTPYLQKLVKEKQAEWESIEDQYMMEGAKDSEKNQADEIRKQLGL